MLHVALASIVKTDFQSLADRGDRRDRTSESNRYILKTLHEPTGTGRANGAFSQFVLESAGQSAEQVRSCHELADTGGPYVGRSVKQIPYDITQAPMKRR